MKEMISDEISVATHIGVDKGAQALNSLGFILTGSPLSVKRVFLPEHCPDILQNKSLSLEMEFSNSTLTAVPRKSSISALKTFVSFSNSLRFTFIENLAGSSLPANLLLSSLFKVYFIQVSTLASLCWNNESTRNQTNNRF